MLLEVVLSCRDLATKSGPESGSGLVFLYEWSQWLGLQTKKKNRYKIQQLFIEILTAEGVGNYKREMGEGFVSNYALGLVWDH